MISNKKTVRPFFYKLLAFSIIILSGVFIAKYKPVKAGNLTDVSVTLSTSRLSYQGSATAESTDDTMITIEADDLWVDGDDQDTDPLVVGDSLTFVTDGARTIEEIVDEDTIVLNSSLGATSRDFALVTKSTLTVLFTTQNYILGDNTTNNGYFRVLVPAADSNNADGSPDAGYFDADDDSVTVSCEQTTGSDEHDFTLALDGKKATGNSYYSTDYYHEYYCTYDGGAAGETIQMTINDIINPAPSASHDSGTAETYTIYVEHIDGNGGSPVVIDSTKVKVGAIEAVKVSAEVEPSLTFTIAGVAASTVTTNEICGITTGANTTTVDSVPFGALTIGSFDYAVQELTVATNAVDGATVTAEANDQLGLNGGACDGDTHNSGTDAYNCIWDANVASMTHTTEQDWTSTSYTGFAFSLDNDDDSDANPAFEYDDDGHTFDARHFADAAESQSEQTIFDTNTQPANDDDVYVCYKIIPDALTSAGDYYNYITYVATPQF